MKTVMAKIKDQLSDLFQEYLSQAQKLSPEFFY